jgi:hypothetical protein
MWHALPEAFSPEAFTMRKVDMIQSRSRPLALILAPFVFGSLTLVLAAGCTPDNNGGNTCAQECAEDEICGADGKCSKLPNEVLDSGPPADAGPQPDSGPVPDAGPGADGGSPTDGGSLQPDAGGGFPLSFAEIPLLRVPRWLTWSEDGTEILFPQEEVVSDQYTYERIERLNPSTGQVEANPLWDFQTNLISRPCRLEDWRREPNIGSAIAGELWLGCRETIPSGSGTLRVVNPDTLQDEGTAPGVIGHTGLAATQDNEAHRVWHQLGGTALSSFEVTDGSFIRVVDTIDASLTFTGIRQLFEIAAPVGSLQTHLLVFDTSPTRLVPIRFFATGWEEAISPLNEKVIPDGPHVVHLLAGQGNFDELDFLAIYPQSGEIRYFHYFYNQSSTDEEPKTFFETENAFMAAPPAAEVDLLRNPVLSPSGDHLFYMHPNLNRIWRVPLTPDSADQVLKYTLPITDDRPRGIVPLTDETVWLAVESPNNNRLMRVTLQ